MALQHVWIEAISNRVSNLKDEDEMIEAFRPTALFVLEGTNAS